MSLPNTTRSPRNLAHRTLRRSHRQRRVDWSCRAALLIAMALVIAFQDSGRAQSGTTVVDPLPYSLNYTIAGGYRIGTVDFTPTQTNGFQTEIVHMTGASAVPPNAEIVAAWMYWETIWSTPSQVQGAKF